MAVEWFGDSITERIKRAVMRGVVNGTESVKERMVERVMNPPKTGRIYKRRGVEHQASAPGESPANDTGNLVKNIRTSYEPEKLTGVVNVGTEYGARLEFGFVGTDSMGRTYDQAPRPFARPSLAEKADDIRKGIVDEVAKELR